MSGRESIPSSNHFPTTQWTQLISIVQQGDGEAAWVALAAFCERYRPAIYSFFRRRGCPHEQAEDFTQEFFASRVLKQFHERKGFLHDAEQRENGRFRSFLCQVLWRFLQDKWNHEKSLRLGGTAEHVSLEQLEASGVGVSHDGFEAFGREFDRVFALQVIQKAAARSRHSQFLEAHLRGEVSQRDAAGQLGISENAFKQSYSNFRKRLAIDLWAEVSKLAGPDDQAVKDEICYLMSLFAESAP